VIELNPKPDGRIPKEVRGPKAEFGFRISGFFRPSGIRISDFMEIGVALWELP